MFAVAQSFLSISWSILLDASFWVIVSFITGGYLHVCVSQDTFKKWFGQTNFRSIGLATAIGMVLPICSCGVVPLGLSLYWSGASLAATLAFMAATPIINPAAALMALGLLGPYLAAVYVLSGFFIPLFLAYSSLLLTPKLQFAPGFSARLPGQYKALTPLTPMSGRPFGTAAPQPPKTEEMQRGMIPRAKSRLRTFITQSRKALHWGLFDLGLSVSKYIIYGIMIAALIFTIIPQWVIAKYLGEPNLLSYSGSVLLGTVMYVCSVGHIPVVAALMAMGASPGVAITFLLSGIATNLPELIAMSRLLKPRVALLYAGGLIFTSVMVGLAVNALLLPDFVPIYSVDESSNVIVLAKSMDLNPPNVLSQLCAVIVLGLGVWSITRGWVQRMRRPHAK